MNARLTVECQVRVRRERSGRKCLEEGPPLPPLPQGRVPRIARLLALAHRFDRMLREGEARDQAELARRGQVTRARLTQVMNLLLLAPDIQEEILHLPRVQRGRDPIQLRHLQPIALEPLWPEQRRLWRACSSLLKLLPSTSNAVERGNRRFRKAQGGVYRVRTKRQLERRLALDLDREQRTPARRQTLEMLHRARAQPPATH